MDVDMPSIFSAAATMLQRVLPQAWSSIRSQSANITQRLGHVRQAAGTPPGRPAISPSSRELFKAGNLLLGVAHQKSGVERRYAIDSVLNASAAQRRGDNARARTILATGLATFFPLSVAA